MTVLWHACLHDFGQQEQETGVEMAEDDGKARRRRIKSTTATLMSIVMTPDNDQEEMKTKRQNQAAAAAAAVYSSPLYFTIRFNKPCIVIATLLASGFILFLAEHTFANQIQIEKEAAIAQASIEMSSFTSSKAADSSNEDDIITEPHEIEMTLPFGSGKDKKTLAYYHCGSGAGDKSENDIEIILLHGAAFTKENWIQSEIFQNLCIKGNDKNSYNNSDGERNVSVSALDLSVGADGAGLESAFDALVEEGVLSGNPAIVVTPSASGRSIVSLVAEGNTEVLKKVVRVWMPVASFAVIGIKDDASFNIFSELNIPILAMNGDKDTKGKAVTKKLVDVADAKGVEMEGGHPCYLDSPTYFVDVIISFINGLKSDLS